MWHWLKLVGDFVPCRHQLIIFIDGGAMVICINMHNEGGDVRGFLAYLRNASCHDFVNDHPPVHWSNSGKSSEQGVGHSEGYMFQIFRIKDGHHEL